MKTFALRRRACCPNFEDSSAAINTTSSSALCHMRFAIHGRRRAPAGLDPAARGHLKVTNPARRGDGSTPGVGRERFGHRYSRRRRGLGREFSRPAGKYIAYLRGDSGATQNPRTNSDIYIAPIDSPTVARPFAATGLRERMPRFSPDGKWLAYTGHDLSQPSAVGPGLLYARQVPGLGGAVTQVSLQEGNSALWSRDGKTLFYFSGGGAAPLVGVRVSDSKGVDVPSTGLVFGRPPPGTGFAQPATPWQGTSSQRRLLVSHR